MSERHPILGSSPGAEAWARWANKKMSELEARAEAAERERDQARAELAEVRAERDRMREALERLEPACRAWLEALPPSTRRRGEGVWLWKQFHSHREAPGIGVEECETVLRALATDKGGESE